MQGFQLRVWKFCLVFEAAPAIACSLHPLPPQPFSGSACASPRLLPHTQGLLHPRPFCRECPSFTSSEWVCRVPRLQQWCSRLGSLNQQNGLPLQLWRPEAWNQGGQPVPGGSGGEFNACPWFLELPICSQHPLACSCILVTFSCHHGVLLVCLSIPVSLPSSGNGLGPSCTYIWTLLSLPQVPYDLSSPQIPRPSLLPVGHLSGHHHQGWSLQTETRSPPAPAGPPLTPADSTESPRVSEPSWNCSPKPGPFLLALSPTLLSTQNLHQSCRTAWGLWPRVTCFIGHFYFSFFFPSH